MKYIAKILHFITVIALTSSVFFSLFVQISFNVNRDYIIKELCENRFNKASHCDGKCYLRKQLKKEEAGSDTPTSNNRRTQEEVNFIQFLVLDIMNVNQIYSDAGQELIALDASVLSYDYIPVCIKPPIFS